MRTEKIAALRAGAGAGRGLGALGPWLGRELAGLLSPALWAALAGLLVVFLLAPQLPLRYGFDVGYEEGVGSDLPYLWGFNTAERGEHGTYRWTRGESTVVLPGVGRRGLAVEIRQLPVSAEVMAAGPQSVELLAGGRVLANAPVRPDGGRVAVMVPAGAVEGGELRLTLRSATFSPAGDPRALGTPIGHVWVSAPGGLGAAPHWGPVGLWLGAVALAWLAVRYCLREVGRGAGAALLVGAVLAAVAALLDPPRWAFGAQAALVGAGLAYGLAVATRAALPGLARRVGAPLDSGSLGWLSLFVALSFALRYGGRLYPASMHGDIGFHHNRFNDAIWGLINIISVNRGVEFPYPPGPYLLIAPFAVLGVEIRTLLQVGAGLADALSAAVIYLIASRVAGQRTALLAAGIYVFTAATFMASWWSFDTHIYTQFAHLLTVAGLCLALEVWQRGDLGAGVRLWWALGVGLLLSLVFLGHFGFLINTVLMVGLVTAGVWLAGWRGAGWARRARWPLAGAFVGAGLVAAVFFYTAYIPMFLGQIETAREGGLTAVANRGPVSRAVLWDTLWRAGFVTHFGLFPLLLMPWGVWLIWRGGRGEAGLGPRRAVAALMLASLAVAVVFAAFPFVAGVTNSPRWMLFIAWVVAVGAAVACEALWRRWWGPVAVVVMGAVVLANTAWIWVGPMLWRIRPPEPF
jgi:hypothetical protein